MSGWSHVNFVFILWRKFLSSVLAVALMAFTTRVCKLPAFSLTWQQLLIFSNYSDPCGGNLIMSVTCLSLPAGITPFLHKLASHCYVLLGEMHSEIPLLAFNQVSIFLNFVFVWILGWKRFLVRDFTLIWSMLCKYLSLCYRLLFHPVGYFPFCTEGVLTSLVSVQIHFVVCASNYCQIQNHELSLWIFLWVVQVLCGNYNDFRIFILYSVC